MQDLSYNLDSYNLDEQSHTSIHKWKMALFNRFVELLRQYSDYTNADGEDQPVSGGMQQYVMSQAPITGDENEQHFPFNRLPINVKLGIFSCLDTKSLCRACQVSQHWNQLTNDNVLWRKKLTNDMYRWTVVHKDPSHVLQTNISYKDCYSLCCPESQKSNKSWGIVQRLNRYLRSTRLAMFGPGMEYGTTDIVQELLHDKTGNLQVKALFPGSFGGSSGGFTMTDRQGNTFHLSFIYSGFQRERQSRSCEEQSAVFQHMLASPHMKQLCNAVQGFIYVAGDGSGPDLSELINEIPRPVLVLVCSQESCVQVAQRLQLGRYTQPWQVRQVTSYNMEQVADGVKWLIPAITTHTE